MLAESHFYFHKAGVYIGGANEHTKQERLCRYITMQAVIETAWCS